MKEEVALKHLYWFVPSFFLFIRTVDYHGSPLASHGEKVFVSTVDAFRLLIAIGYRYE